MGVSGQPRHKSLGNRRGSRQDNPLVQGDLEKIPKFNATTESLSKPLFHVQKKISFPCDRGE